MIVASKICGFATMTPTKAVLTQLKLMPSLKEKIIKDRMIWLNRNLRIWRHALGATNNMRNKAN